MDRTLKHIIFVMIIGISVLSCSKNNKTNDALEEEAMIIEQTKNKNNISSDNLISGNTISSDFQNIIEGYYVDDEDADNIIELKIFRNEGNNYTYEFNTGKRILKGSIHFNVTENNERYLVLEGIRWEYWKFQNEETENENKEEEWVEMLESELPDEIELYIGENELIIQNYGNAMNNYLKFGDIDKKYIHLKK